MAPVRPRMVSTADKMQGEQPDVRVKQARWSSWPRCGREPRHSSRTLATVEAHPLCHQTPSKRTAQVRGADPSHLRLCASVSSLTPLPPWSCELGEQQDPVPSTVRSPAMLLDSLPGVWAPAGLLFNHPKPGAGPHHLSCCSVSDRGCVAARSLECGGLRSATRGGRVRVPASFVCPLEWGV